MQNAWLSCLCEKCIGFYCTGFVVSCRNRFFFAMIIGKNPQKFTDFVNYLLYTGRGKTKEVEQGKDLSGQLHGSKFLAAPVMSVSWKYIQKETTDKN